MVCCSEWVAAFASAVLIAVSGRAEFSAGGKFKTGGRIDGVVAVDAQWDIK
ncbi:MAG: hypothetical protein IPJ88_03255 [Myxococcales bacterium]|nr:MAG: hypothetical protein IPJ88_03255 [Myxococcales bacterium]